jgi:hypothetical protein
MPEYKRIKSTIMVSEDIYKEIRILAIRKSMDISSIVEEALREKITREYQPQQEIHLQQTEQQSQQPLLSKLKEITEKYKVNESEITESIESFYHGTDILTKDPEFAETIKYMAEKYSINKLEAANYLKIQKYMSSTHQQDIKQQIEAGK